jgi:hypothetical protein
MYILDAKGTWNLVPRLSNCYPLSMLEYLKGTVWWKWDVRTGFYLKAFSLVSLAHPRHNNAANNRLNVYGRAKRGDISQKTNAKLSSHI